MKQNLLIWVFLCTVGVISAQQLNFEEPSYERKKEMYPLLLKGELSLLDKVAENREAGVLWHYALSISSDPLFSTEPSRRIQARAKELLILLPGHTQNIIDQIELHAEQTKDIKLSADGNNIAGTEKPADTEEELRVIEDLQSRANITAVREFNALKQLGSPECVQTLMTYLDDERCIGMNSAGSRPGFRPALSNNWQAIQGLCSILGEENPAKPEFNTGGKPFNLTAIRQLFVVWWLSDASKKWRTPIVKTSRSHLLPRASKTVPAKSSSPLVILETPGREALWPVLIILCLAAVAAVFGFSKLRRGQNP